MFFRKEKGWGNKRKEKHAQKIPDGMEHNPHYSLTWTVWTAS